MVLDRKIKQALEQNSEWNGSADGLWENIAVQLQPARRWWQLGRFWLGTAAAALLLGLVLRTSLAPPAMPELEPAPRMQTFSALMAEELSIQGGEKLEIALDIFLLTDQSDAIEGLRLLIWEKEDGRGEKLWAEHALAEDGLFETSLLMASAPAEPGTYRLVVEGQMLHDGLVYEVRGEKEITVEE